MTAKKRARYEIKEKKKIVNELDKNLHVKGPNVGKPNFYLVAKLYPNINEKCSINLKTVKPRLTNLIQPADVVLFGTLKNAIIQNGMTGF